MVVEGDSYEVRGQYLNPRKRMCEKSCALVSGLLLTLKLKLKYEVFFLLFILFTIVLSFLENDI